MGEFFAVFWCVQARAERRAGMSGLAKIVASRQREADGGSGIRRERGGASLHLAQLAADH